MNIDVCAIVKNEAAYLEEWVEFHKLMGVSQFYIYDNGSTDGTVELLEKYATTGYVNWTPWPHRPGQVSAYWHHLTRVTEKLVHPYPDFTAFIDIDEFLYPSFGSLDTLSLAIQGVASKAQLNINNVSQILVNWNLFGSNQKTFYSTDLVLDRFTKRKAAPDLHVKSLVRAEHVKSEPKSPHYFDVAGITLSSEGVTEIPKPLLEVGNNRFLTINHYHTKSKEEYFEKCKKGRADNGTFRDFVSNFAAHDTNESTDYFVTQWSDQVFNRIWKLPWNLSH